MGAGTQNQQRWRHKRHKHKVKLDIAAYDAAIQVALKHLTPEQQKHVLAGSKQLHLFLGLEQQDESAAAVLGTDEAEAKKNKTPREKGKVKGGGQTGRRKPEDFPNAKTEKVTHPTLMPGHLCPECSQGKVYLLNRPDKFRHFVGNPLIEVTFYELEVYRCNNPACETKFPAPLPEGVGPDIYDPSAVIALAMTKYGMGFPGYRLSQLLKMMGTPMSASTQWDVVRKAADRLRPVFDCLLEIAAQGKLGYFDDTSVKIRQLKRAADDKRTGIHTTGILSVSEAFEIGLYISGNQHAGENRADLLARRSEDLPPMLQMSDALAANFSKLDQAILERDILACCLLHGRRGFVKVASSHPLKCGHVIKLLGKVYHHEAVCKERRYSDDERLLYHQRKSGPVMAKLKKWLDKMILFNKVEENSTLGEAIQYMRKHWNRLTLFLRVSGAALDNNPVERLLKTAVLLRKNALFYQTAKGAEVGDLFMSLFQTCRLNRVNPFDYLTELLRNHKLAAEKPQDWMPWNYKEALHGKKQEQEA